MWQKNECKLLICILFLVSFFIYIWSSKIIQYVALFFILKICLWLIVSNIFDCLGHWYANSALITEPPADIPPHGELVVLNSYAFSDYDSPLTTPAGVNKEESAPSEVPPAPAAASSEPPKEVQQPPSAVTTEEPFNGDLAEELSKIPQVFNLNRVPIFNMYLPDAKVSELLKPGIYFN